MSFILLPILKRIHISILWISLPADQSLHLSGSIRFQVTKLDGKPFEVTKPIEVLDDAFGFKIKTFSNTAEFRQKITAVAYSFTVKGAVNFMACNNATCSPPKDVEI